jgi:hypothetical protein
VVTGPGFDASSTLTAETDLSVSLRNADMSYSSLAGTSLEESDFSGAKLDNVDLTDASLVSSVLGPVSLLGAQLNGAKMRSDMLAGAIFEPVSMPEIEGLETAKGLAAMRFADSPYALIRLREEFKRRGLTDLENQVTYAIRHTEATRANWFGWVFNMLLFHLTCRYGMSSDRPLKIILVVLLVFAIAFYLPAQNPEVSKAGIFVHWDGSTG